MNDAWQRVTRERGDALVREFECGDFKGSVALVNAILPLAEAAAHHPDLEISWGSVRVVLTTHSEGGVTDRDLDLAQKIDALA